MFKEEQLFLKKEAAPKEGEKVEIEEPFFETEKSEKETEGLKEKEIAQEKLEKLREQFKELREKIEIEKQTAWAPFKDFENYFFSHNRIELSEEKRRELEKWTADFQKQNVFRGPRILTGNKTATEYDNKVENFSTKTAIKELASGEKIFVVDSYPSSLIHRLGDSVLRRFCGVKNFKAPNRIWKETFERRSNIPTIRIENKNAVAMPYIENVNLRDLMTFDKEIKNWGPIEWAENINIEEKKEILKSVVLEMEAMHRQGKTWGEAILANMIIDKNKKVWICDPEILFYNEVPKIEQKASDLKDIIFTSAASLACADKLEDYKEVVKLVFDNYSDKKVVETLIGAAKRKPTLKQRLFFVYTKNRYSPLKDFRMHEEIRRAIAEHGEKE